MTDSVYQAFYQDPRFTPSLVQQELVAAGHLGRKSGRGFYRYDAPRSAAAIAFAPPAQAALPQRVTLHGDWSSLADLAQLLSENAGRSNNPDQPTRHDRRRYTDVNQW